MLSIECLIPAQTLVLRKVEIVLIVLIELLFKMGILDNVSFTAGDENPEFYSDVRNKNKRNNAASFKHAYKQYRNRLFDAVYRLTRSSRNKSFHLRSSNCFSEQANLWKYDKLDLVKPKRGVVIHSIKLRNDHDDENVLLDSESENALLDSEDKNIIIGKGNKYKGPMNAGRSYEEASTGRGNKYKGPMNAERSYEEPRISSYGSDFNLHDMKRKQSKDFLKYYRTQSYSPNLNYPPRRQSQHTQQPIHGANSSCNRRLSVSTRDRPSIVRFCEKTVIYIYPSESVTNCNYYNDTHLYNGTTNCHCDNYYNNLGK